ncbi:4Fe-4S dicluster domain-containing protein [Moorella sulfitireducens]|uniref:4Fe-4S dicluster domain-containing protein n=1 Tax=Neomoorella sulfitireducens TaxID=2972948 RepID=UPI0021ACB011|nr:4Fe-4S dicluster domain-containing protein [Moorella sulfitireducens]
MTKRYYLIYDLAKCIGCHNCLMACKDEHVDNEWPGYTLPQPRHGHKWINIHRIERGQYPHIDVKYIARLCRHCDDAPCIKAAGGAIYKRPDGIVMIDPGKARGKKELTAACPYGMILWNEEREVPQKCTLCAHLIDQGWQKTRCVQACPTGALRLEKLTKEEMEHMINEEKLEVLDPGHDTSPGVYYKNLYLYNKCFISGSVAVEIEGKTECADGAKVILRQGQEEIAATTADCFGDFKFDALPRNSGLYIIEILFDGCEKKIIELELKNSLNVGTVFLT